MLEDPLNKYLRWHRRWPRCLVTLVGLKSTFNVIHCNYTHSNTAQGASNDASSATVVVTLPADAKLTVDGATTTSISGERIFTTPALPAGKEFYYEFKAEVIRNGKTRAVTQQVLVRSGEETRVKLSIPETESVAAGQ